MLKIYLFQFLIAGLNFCDVFGRVKIVNSHEDYRVYITEKHADIEVKIVDNFETSIGHWKIVNSHEKYRIKIVNSRTEAHFSVKFVNNFPTCKR